MQPDPLKHKAIPRKFHVIPPFMKPVTHIRIPSPPHGLRIAVVPDCQNHPGTPIDHLKWCGKYLALKRPDVIIQIGDFTDLPSLSTHDTTGSLQLEGKRYQQDIDSSKAAMNTLMTPIAKVSGWEPHLYLTLGNHEHRIVHAVNADPKLEGLISLNDLCYKDYGWHVFPFLQPIVVGGVAFCHYFPSGIMGKPITSAKALLTKLHMSAFAGHLQGRDIAFSRRADGTDMTAIISGSFYQHAEEYLSPFTNNHWRGMFMLHETRNGSFNEMAVSINYLQRRFGK
jgi:calcineurin-like phosphoesterase family protein